MTNRLHNAAEPAELPSCKTDAICGHRSASQISKQMPFRYGEGGFLLLITGQFYTLETIQRKLGHVSKKKNPPSPYQNGNL